jgi:hypothetical protein
MAPGGLRGRMRPLSGGVDREGHLKIATFQDGPAGLARSSRARVACANQMAQSQPAVNPVDAYLGGSPAPRLHKTARTATNAGPVMRTFSVVLPCVSERVHATAPRLHVGAFSHHGTLPPAEPRSLLLSCPAPLSPPRERPCAGRSLEKLLRNWVPW